MLPTDKALESLPLVWSERFHLGHSTIDSQHQVLFEIYNRLVGAYKECNGHQIITDVLGDLVIYTQSHFREEEAIMARLQYSDLKAHKRSHGRLLTEIDLFISDMDDDKPILTYEVLAFVRNWLKEHVLNEDMLLKPLLSDSHVG